jgi:hypothetical protein
LTDLSAIFVVRLMMLASILLNIIENIYFIILAFTLQSLIAELKLVRFAHPPEAENNGILE